MQDTIKPVNVAPVSRPDQLPDTTNAPAVRSPAPASKPSQNSGITPQPAGDSVCLRNPVADITFSDTTNIINANQLYRTGRFPYTFIEKNIERLEESRTSLISRLKPGQEIPARSFHHDWFLLIILLAAFLYSVIRTASKSMIPESVRFLFFRGINDPSSRDIGGLFNWQATLLNLISFLNIGLFLYYAAEWYNAIPANIPGYLAWLMLTGIVITIVTMRHVVNVITGNISDQQEAFREYLLTIYQSHRLSGIILFIIIVLITYTEILPVKLLIEMGFAALLLMYFIRAIRLLLIFINRNISIFYLILYLCSLEILPFLVLIKYSLGRF